MRAELGDIINFGEWNINKREENFFISSFAGLNDKDWIVFRATDTDDKGDIVPMTIRRKSPRIMHVKDKDERGNEITITEKDGTVKYKEHIETWYTRFISDVFLFVAPANYIDTEENMHELLQAVEAKGLQQLINL